MEMVELETKKEDVSLRDLFHSVDPLQLVRKMNWQPSRCATDEWTIEQTNEWQNPRSDPTAGIVQGSWEMGSATLPY